MGNEIKKEDMRKAVDEFIDEIFDREEAEGTDEVVKAKAKDDDCTMKAKKKAKEEVEDFDDEEKEMDDDEEVDEDESSTKSKKKSAVYKKGFMDAMNQMKAKMGSKKKMAKSIVEDDEDETMEDANTALLKSISALAEQVVGLQGTVDKLAKQPAGLRKSIRSSDIVRKSAADGQDIDIDDNTVESKGDDLGRFLKSQAGRARVADVLFEDGVLKGRLSTREIAEYEAVGKVSDPKAQNVIKSLVRDRIDNGTF